MKRWGAWTLAGLVAGVSAVVVPGGGASASTTVPTLAAPASATYYSTVTLTGSTSRPGEAVDVLFRAAGTKTYVARRHLTADAGRHWSATYTALSTQYVAARAAGVNSTVHVIRVPTAHCTVSRAAFTTLPIPRQDAGKKSNVAEFSATRGTTWAGTVYDAFASSLALVTWKSGSPHVLARYTYRSTPFEQSRSVRAVGFTPKLALVANVQDPARKVRNFADAPLRAYYWYRGVRHTMSHGSWSAWAATGVSDAGRVVGWAATGSYPHQRFSVITWPHAGDRYQVVASVGGAQPTPVIDARGDLAWTDGTGQATLRTVEGATHPLLARPYPGAEWSSDGIEVGGASSDAFYAAGQSGLLRWFVHPELANGAVMHGAAIAGPSANIVDAVGRQNSVTTGLPTVYLRTASGAYVRTPAQQRVDDVSSATNAINNHGTLAFTAKSDHRVHFLRCTTS